MANEVMTLKKEEIGTKVISTNGSMLPGNFDKLSERKQKSIILSELADGQNEICSMLSEDEHSKAEIKKIQQLLKTSKEFKRMVELKKNRKLSANRVSQLLSERQGILKVASKMGLDLKEELRKLKAIG